MDPCPFARLIVESLALKLPRTARSQAGNSGVHPSATPCYCKISFKNFPSQTALLPLTPGGDGSQSPLPESTTSAAGFHLDAMALRRISLSSSPAALRVAVYAGRMGAGSCGVAGAGRKIGSVDVKMDLKGAEAKAMVFQSGWVSLGDKGKKNKSPAAVARLHIVVRSEPEPRFVFQFGGEPECSPVVFQVQGNTIRQPVFSCKFSADRNGGRTRSLPSNFEPNKKGWLRRTLSGDRDNRPSRDRKGWMVMIYDLSGSPVAAASIITPFVPSPGSDRVSRSNPGAWLILRPSHHHHHHHQLSPSTDSWKPWARLEAWRERGSVDGLGYRFELLTDTASPARGIAIAEATMSVKAGGQFTIDSRTNHHNQQASCSPVKGFVMESTVEGEGKPSRPVVMVGAQHVTCMADAALFVALSAAVDLSMDACRLFSHRLRKELCSDLDHSD